MMVLVNNVGTMMVVLFMINVIYLAGDMFFSINFLVNYGLASVGCLNFLMLKNFKEQSVYLSSSTTIPPIINIYKIQGGAIQSGEIVIS